MALSLEQIIQAASFCIAFSFFVYGYNCYYMLAASRTYKKPNIGSCRRAKPTVAIQLTIYNEKYVIKRLVEACAKVAEKYGKEKVSIQILDDSDDETVEEVDRVCEKYSKLGYRIRAIRREGREGFKAGALQNALMQTDEEYVAILDSDFTPTEDFLDETIPYLTENLHLGLVQCRWGYINREYSFLSRTFAIGMDGHFLIEQPGRYASNCFLNFNGSGGVLRKTAIVEAGGWMPDTLAEDLDLSYRMQLKGFKILYLRDLSVPGEIPPTTAAFKRQQARWARGSMQVAKKHLPALIKSRNLTFKQKIEGFIHLTYYFVHPLMLASFILTVVATFLGLKTAGLPINEFIIDVRGATIIEHVGSFIAGFLKFLMSLSPSWLIFYVCILIGAVASWLLYIATLRNQGLSVKDNLKYLIALGFIGYGISISNSLEVAKALFLRNVGEFKRTPKYAVKKESDEWKNKKYQVPLQKAMLFELAMGVLGVASICFAVQTLNYGMVPILVLFTICYINMVVLTKLHSKKEEL